MKIIVLSSHTASLFWFRMDMMQDFIKNGHEVVAVGSEAEEAWTERFKQNNITYRQIFVERNGLNPFQDIRTFLSIYKVIKQEEPERIFVYQAKTIIYGSIAAKLRGLTEVYPLVAGLGSVFRGNGFKNVIIKKMMKLQYKLACYCSKKVFFQNNDDKNEFIHNGLILENKTVMINGSGVNLEKFVSTQLPDKPAFLYIGRLIKDKGIVEYLEACKLVKENQVEARCLLVGPFDTNPSSLQPEELQVYLDQGIVEYYGEQNDVRPFIAQCSTYVLPSYHEGTPKTVLEAMAMGRAIITSDAPGCRETVDNGINGYLVAVKDINALAQKMIFLAGNLDINRKMGLQSSKLAREKYDVIKVNHVILKTMQLLDSKDGRK